MFKHFSWPIKVNSAIAGFGISPIKFDGKLRSEFQSLGINADLAAHETALILLPLKIGINYDNTFESIFASLRHDGKIDIAKPEVIDAPYEMGYDVDPRWGYDAVPIFNGDVDKDDMFDRHDYAKSPIAQLFARFRWFRIKVHVDQIEENGQT